MTTIEDGPGLALAAELSPSRVFLLHTPDLANRAQETRTAIRKRLGLADDDVSIRVVDVEGDPTDAGKVFPALREAVLSLLEGMDQAHTRLATNVSSGTPMMQLALHLLVERGVLPDRRYQVRESRHTPAGESRVRRIALPLL